MDENTPTQKHPFGTLQHNLKQDKGGVTLHGAQLTEYCIHSLWILPNTQIYQAPKHVTVTDAKALQGNKSSMNRGSVKYLEKFLNVLPE